MQAWETSYKSYTAALTTTGEILLLVYKSESETEEVTTIDVITPLLQHNGTN